MQTSTIIKSVDHILGHSTALDHSTTEFITYFYGFLRDTEAFRRNCGALICDLEICLRNITTSLNSLPSKTPTDVISAAISEITAATTTITDLFKKNGALDKSLGELLKESEELNAFLKPGASRNKLLDLTRINLFFGITGFCNFDLLLLAFAEYYSTFNDLCKIVEKEVNQIGNDEKLETLKNEFKQKISHINHELIKPSQCITRLPLLLKTLLQHLDPKQNPEVTEEMPENLRKLFSTNITTIQGLLSQLANAATSSSATTTEKEKRGAASPTQLAASKFVYATIDALKKIITNFVAKLKGATQGVLETANQETPILEKELTQITATLPKLLEEDLRIHIEEFQTITAKQATTANRLHKLYELETEMAAILSIIDQFTQEPELVVPAMPTTINPTLNTPPTILDSPAVDETTTTMPQNRSKGSVEELKSHYEKITTPQTLSTPPTPQPSTGSTESLRRLHESAIKSLQTTSLPPPRPPRPHHPTAPTSTLFPQSQKVAHEMHCHNKSNPPPQQEPTVTPVRR